MKPRTQVISEIRQLGEEARLIIFDAKHWNNCVRKPDEPPIDPDPDGMLSEVAREIDEFLERDTGQGKIDLDLLSLLKRIDTSVMVIRSNKPPR